MLIKRIVVISTVICLLFGMNGCSSEKKTQYETAMTLMDEGFYEAAIQLFEGLDYKDSAENLRICKFQIALELEKAKDYEAAALLFQELGDYVHKYKRYEHTQLSAKEKAREMRFHQIAEDVIQDALGIYKNQFTYSAWDVTVSDFDFTIGEGDHVVVTWHQYAYYPSVVPKEIVTNPEWDTKITLKDYGEQLCIDEKNYDQIKTEWLAFMSANYKGMSKKIR